MGDEVQDLSYRNGTVKELSFPEPTLENRVILISRKSAAFGSIRLWRKFADLGFFQVFPVQVT